MDDFPGLPADPVQQHAIGKAGFTVQSAAVFQKFIV